MVDLRVDRLNVQRADVVDDEKLEKIEKATERNGEQPYQGERTRLLRGRDLNCGDFSDFADLRRVDLSGAQLRGANLERAKLQGSSLASAVLSQASLKRAQLRGALLDRAELQGAFLAGAQLQGASLENAKLQGAFLNENPQLQGASLNGAELQGASLVGAELQGASLNRAKLQGAFLFLTDLQGASLDDAELQGASFTDVQLQAASLNGAKLHGARLGRANLTHAVLSRSWIWRADNAACTNARVIDPKLDALSGDDAEKPTPARPEQVRKLIAGWMSGMPDGARRDTRSRRLLERLTVDPDKDDTAAIADAWLQCAKASSTIPEKDFHAARTTLLRNLVCDDPENGPTIGAGITATLRRLLPSFRAKVASALLGEDGRECAVAKSYDEPTRKELRRLARPAQPFASPK
jgi:uncharacterized protein YjbI with pentapeptide repeats